MSVRASDRHHLFRRLEEALGPAEAATLIDLLPGPGWSDLLTKSDPPLKRADLHAELAQLRVELRGELAQFGADLRALGAPEQ